MVKVVLAAVQIMKFILQYLIELILSYLFHFKLFVVLSCDKKIVICANAYLFLWG